MHFRILKMIATALECTPNSFSAGAPPRNQLEELTALLQTP